MNRWDIINSFIEKHNYKSYLEIGYYKGWSFDQVKCEKKYAVDPNPCKNEAQQKMPNGEMVGPIVETEHIINKTTSDSFFFNLPDYVKYDIIFIDGLHEASQVTKDIHNALDHLKPGGIIVMHDCNPPEYLHTTTGINGCWTGDTYKAFIKWRLQNPMYDSYTIDTDWGCGVITQDIVYLDWLEYHDIDTSKETEWSYFDQHRKDLLNLISIEEFKTKLNERIENSNSPA